MPTAPFFVGQLDPRFEEILHLFLRDSLTLDWVNLKHLELCERPCFIPFSDSIFHFGGNYSVFACYFIIKNLEGN